MADCIESLMDFAGEHSCIGYEYEYRKARIQAARLLSRK